jgi:hypothetical protein
VAPVLSAPSPQPAPLRACCGLAALLGCIRDNRRLATVLTQWEWYEDDKLDPTSTCFALFMNTIVDAVGNLLKVA